MSRPLPDVTHVAPGVWSVPVPIPGSSVGWILVYALVGDGVWLVDAGWDTPVSREALDAGLSEAGASLADVSGVLVTHVHADHFGLAGHVREVSDAWVGMHPADTALVADRYEDPTDLLARGDAWLRSAGAPPDVLADLRDASLRILEAVHAITPDRALRDDEVLTSPVGELEVLHTPGHTPGHVCLDLPSGGVVFTGDHLLPRISPNVGWHPQSDPDPLGDYVASLDRVGALGAPTALPGHVHAFGPPVERARELVDHHADELDRVADVLAAGAVSAWEVAATSPWSRPWGDMPPFEQRGAVAEVCAHLVRLERTGRAACDRTSPTWRWSAA